MCLQKSPQFADFLKSATEQLPRLHSWNLPLDSHLSYLHVLAEIPPSLHFFCNLPLDSYLSYLHVLARNLPFQFADFLKSATGQYNYIYFPKIPPVDRFSEICLHVLAEIPLQVADFLTSATGQSCKLPTCACRNSPQIAVFLKSATGQLL